MQRTEAVQVVLGEGEPGLLRLILEAQGFVVIGHARGDDELRLVLSVTDPGVIVLDAGISVQAAIEVSRLADGVPIVAVWPTGVAAVMADERIDPEQAFQDLGDAVRRAASRRRIGEDGGRPPEPEEAGAAARVRPGLPDEVLAPAIEPDPVPVRAGSRRSRHLLVTAAAWALSLIAFSTIGLAVPGAIRVLEERDRTPRPSVQAGPTSASTGEPRDERSQPRPGASGPSDDGCEPKAQDARSSASGRGRPEDPGRGCGAARGKTGGEHGQGRGRPDEPGERGRGNGSEENEGAGPDGGGDPAGDAGDGANGSGHGNGSDRSPNG